MSSTEPTSIARRFERLSLAVTAFVVAWIVTFVVMPSQERWCYFSEFGYLSRIPVALALILLLGVAAVVGLIGLIRLLRSRRGVLLLAFSLGLAAGALIAPRFLEPRCPPI
jgi:hypothetical protein